MLKLTNLGLAALLVGGLGLSSVTAEAVDNPSVKARQSVMTVLSYYIGGLGAMAKGEAEYDADVASTHAASLHHAAQLDISGMFPEGTDNAALPDVTAALPAIWENPAGVGEAHQALVEASVNLAAVAGDGLDPMKAALGEVGKACGGCHEDFRQKK